MAKQNAVVLSGWPKASQISCSKKSHVFLMDTAHCVLSISDYDFWLYIKLIKQLTVKKKSVAYQWFRKGPSEAKGPG